MTNDDKCIILVTLKHMDTILHLQSTMCRRWFSRSRQLLIDRLWIIGDLPPVQTPVRSLGRCRGRLDVWLIGRCARRIFGQLPSLTCAAKLQL